ncbi:TPA: single-stranded DNA-binding protein [Enterococcus faecalis]|uniref:single-stranded DNA-binding protein n=1 Tax=Enterococcus faecalis TaxID=1351 RepID=UPI0003312EC7|nr:single-stranded DNA-binding protein [Enterococcus faecalis]EOK60560.1 single-stranded DNA-binding protein [Enterococcus faecalis EnGen0069]PTN82976.1 single-stranded DNA-binding protein [Enterococcus faecalis]HAP4308798.1 single-stranded DNA-binding protein [Enterococcus faecalis]
MINNVTLVGRLTKDPDLRYTQSGTAVGQFTLAVNRNFTNQQGDREADFINCVIWRKAAESFANYARKGTLIGLTGRIQTRNYDNQQGQRVYVTEIVVENFQLLESKEVNEQRRSSKPDQATFDKQPSVKPDPLDPFEPGVSPIDISDSDLPF